MPTAEIDITQYLTKKGAAEYLGVSESTIANWIRSGRIAHYKIGALVRIDPADLDAFILASYRDSQHGGAA